MQVLKRINKNWLIVIVLWIVAIFFAIVKLPNVTNLITDYGQPQFTNQSAVIQAQQMQSHWGHGASNASTVNVVYNNPNTRITTTEQQKINQAVTKLQKNRTLSIKQISTINNSPNGKLQLTSNDQSTQIVKLQVDQSAAANPTIINQIQQQMNVAGLNTYVTSPSIIKSINAQRVAKLTKLIMVIAFAITTVLFALFFRSIVAPLISAITIGIADLTALSLIGNLVVHKNLPFSQFTPVVLTVLITVLGSIFNFMVIKATSEEMASHRDMFNASSSGLNRVIAPIIWTSLTLVVAFAALLAIPFSPIRGLAPIAIAVLILMVAVLTINPIFTSLLGPEIIWPKRSPINVERHRGWHQLTRLSLWQPIAGIILVAYIIGPFAYSYRDNITYNELANAKSDDQAIVGARVLQAHFSAGKPTPVTIYIQNRQPLNQQDNLEKIDALTTKLKSLKGVNAVYSVTQPSGVPISKYYVQNQLNKINKQIDTAQLSLSDTLKAAQQGQKLIDNTSLNSQINAVNQLKSDTTALISDNNRIASQLTGATSHASVASRQATSRNVKAYQAQVNSLNDTLNSAASSMNTIQSDGQKIVSSSDSISTKLSKYAAELQKAKAIFGTISTQTKSVNQKLNSIYDYLDGLAKSSVGAVYYITPTQLADTDFQQSLYTYNSEDNKTTKLTVDLQADPNNAKQTSAALKAIDKDVDVMLQGTTLSHAKVAISGQPVELDIIHHQFVREGLIALAIVLLIALVAICAISRSLLNPIYWLLTAGFSLITGFQLSTMLIHYLDGISQISWNAAIISSIIFGSYALSQLMVVALRYRRRDYHAAAFLGQALSEIGQTTRYGALITITVGLGLLFTNDPTFKQAGFIISTATLIFTIVFPLLAVALNRLAEQLSGQTNE